MKLAKWLEFDAKEIQALELNKSVIMIPSHLLPNYYDTLHAKNKLEFVDGDSSQLQRRKKTSILGNDEMI